MERRALQLERPDGTPLSALADHRFIPRERWWIGGPSGAGKLGIFGGSNGVLLMGGAMTQRPELWEAVVIQVPLLDMLRYQKTAAGPSWQDEYGSVDNPEERAFLALMSPYHQLKADGTYPEPFVWTTTRDDRVGPQHARKFAARLAEFGLPYLFFEDTAGGHAGDGDLEQMVRLRTMDILYFNRRLKQG